MDQILDWILLPLDFVYRQRWIAPLIFLPIMLAIAGWVHVHAWRRTKPYLVAARERVAVLRDALGEDSDPAAERASFATHYVDVSAAMNAGGRGTDELVQAWREFHESII